MMELFAENAGYLPPFSEWGRGNRSLGSKERFPRKKYKQEELA